jgi:hypothetical protein
MSTGEQIVASVLEDLNVSFECEWRFSDPKVWRLRYDFCVLDEAGNPIAIIEFHGKQHYEVVSFGGSKVAPLEKQKERDAQKREYIVSLRIPFIEISYLDTGEEVCVKIAKVLEKQK